MTKINWNREKAAREQRTARREDARIEALKARMALKPHQRKWLAMLELRDRPPCGPLPPLGNEQHVLVQDIFRCVEMFKRTPHPDILAHIMQAHYLILQQLGITPGQLGIKAEWDAWRRRRDR